MKKFFFLIIIVFQTGYTQDPVFTQFYNIPESMNPAFAGGSGSTELGILNRTQWPGLDYSLNSQFFYFDKGNSIIPKVYLLNPRVEPVIFLNLEKGSQRMVMMECNQELKLYVIPRVFKP